QKYGHTTVEPPGNRPSALECCVKLYSTTSAPCTFDTRSLFATIEKCRLPRESLTCLMFRPCASSATLPAFSSSIVATAVFAPTSTARLVDWTLTEPEPSALPSSQASSAGSSTNPSSAHAPAKPNEHRIST